MQVKEIMTQNVEVISVDASIKDAARKMKTMDIGILPVIDGDQLIGMVTDRDIVVRAVAEGQDVSRTLIRDVMTPNVIYCFDDQDLNEATKIMEDNQVRRILVLNRNKQPVGIISQGDVAVQSGDDHLVEELVRHVSEPAHVSR